MTKKEIDPNRIPEHVAIVMDGNGRWAKKRGLPRLSGHNAGMSALKEIVRHSSKLGISYLTVYAFSTENWRRPEEEVSGIFRLLVFYVQKEIKELNENNVRVRILGDCSALSQEVQASIKTAVDTTKDNTGLKFNIALNYGGRADIIHAVNTIIAQAEREEDGIRPIDEARLEAHLYTAGMPDPDLLIRTGGEFRISNFLIWQTAYSEFVVSDVFWPDFSPEEYEKAIIEFQSRERRFGGLK